MSNRFPQSPQSHEPELLSVHPCYRVEGDECKTLHPYIVDKSECVV